MPPLLGDTHQGNCFGAVACNLLTSTAFFHSSWRALYGSRFVRTCLARGGRTLQRQGQIPSCTLAETLPAPARSYPCTHVPFGPHRPLQCGTSFRHVLGAAQRHRAPGAIPGHARVRANPRGSIPQGSGLGFLDPVVWWSHLLDSPWPCWVLPHTYSGRGLSHQGAGVLVFSAS